MAKLPAFVFLFALGCSSVLGGGGYDWNNCDNLSPRLIATKLIINGELGAHKNVTIVATGTASAGATTSGTYKALIFEQGYHDPLVTDVGALQSALVVSGNQFTLNINLMLPASKNPYYAEFDVKITLVDADHAEEGCLYIDYGFGSLDIAPPTPVFEKEVQEGGYSWDNCATPELLVTNLKINGILGAHNNVTIIATGSTQLTATTGLWRISIFEQGFHDPLATYVGNLGKALVIGSGDFKFAINVELPASKSPYYAEFDAKLDMTNADNSQIGCVSIDYGFNPGN